MSDPKTLDDVVSENPKFRVLRWEVKTPRGETISVSTRAHALKVAAREWPQLSSQTIG